MAEIWNYSDFSFPEVPENLILEACEMAGFVITKHESGYIKMDDGTTWADVNFYAPHNISELDRAFDGMVLDDNTVLYWFETWFQNIWNALPDLEPTWTISSRPSRGRRVRNSLTDEPRTIWELSLTIE